MAEIEYRKPTKEFVVQYFVKSLDTWIRFDGIKKRGKFSEEQTFGGRDSTERKKNLIKHEDTLGVIKNSFHEFFF